MRLILKYGTLSLRLILRDFEFEDDIEVRGFELESGNVVVSDIPFGLGFQLGLPSVQVPQPSSLAW